ncbi:MAG TPA: VC0807 family protein [Ktedonobacteraceae bacterium]|nr:VC0807 family protein [Ktedonobacteraceae bacterium]
MSTTPSSTDLAHVGQAIKANAIRGIIISVVINGAFPFLIYWVLTNYTSISPFLALVATGIPSILHSLVGLIRQKRIDFLAGIVLAGLAVSVIITVLGGAPKVFLIRESFFTITFGLALLISLALPRPILFYMARLFASGNDPSNIARFNLIWQEHASFRRRLRVMTAVWGAGLLLEAVIRITLVIMLSVQQFLAISPFVIYGIFAILVIWTFRTGQRGRQRSTELERGMAAQGQVASTISASTESTE